jgi:hypothetical protein
MMFVAACNHIPLKEYWMNMESKSVALRRERLDLVPAADERASRANGALCNTCRERGLRVSSWKDFAAWKDYVEGSIDESELAEAAARELEGYSKNHGKYVVIDKENPIAPSGEIEKRKRAKRANRIFRDLCRNTGLTLCFFNGFSSWSDYIRGKMTEKEFIEKARMEVDAMLQKNARV